MKRKGSRSYYVRVKVPKGAREVLGKVELWRSLDTEDFAVACARAVVEGGRMWAQIEAARRNLDGTRKDAKGDPTVEQRKAEAWWMERRVPHPKRPGLYVIPEDLEPAWDATVERLAGEPVNEDDGVSAPRYDPDRERAALTLVGKVTGAVVPIGEELDRYMAQEGVKASYAARTRTATKALTDWLTTNRHADNIHAVTGRVADQFADSVAEGRTVKTLNSYISALSAYWSWLRRRHIVQENPWAGLSRREVDRSGNAEKRPFTDDEIKALLSGPADPTLRDMMLLAALTGMRQVEIGNLRVRDAEGGVFVVTKSKTTAGERSVPTRWLAYSRGDRGYVGPDRYRHPDASKNTVTLVTAFLDEIIERVNGLFDGELSDEDQLAYVTGFLRSHMAASDELRVQAANNTSAQFANSPTLRRELMDAAMDSDAAFNAMSRQVLNSETVREELLKILLGPGQLYEMLRGEAER